MTDQLLRACKEYVDNGGMLSGSTFTKVSIRSFKMLDIDTNAAEQYLEQNREKLFTEQLFAFIDRTGKQDSEIYKKALIDRRLFSKIRSNKNYIPAKKTVIALCLALELNRAEADRSSADLPIRKWHRNAAGLSEALRKAVGFGTCGTSR